MIIKHARLLNVIFQNSMKVALCRTICLYSQHNNDTNVDNMLNLFYENRSNTVNKHVPTRKMTRKDIKLHIKPWINQKIVKLIKYRDRLKRKFKRRPTIENEYLYKKFEIGW